uniref:Uncharacterized protein n=1 Tax=Rhizophora mucronata TaxID=61149 RepID=A0A2P2Q4S3_RHIMU
MEKNVASCNLNNYTKEACCFIPTDLLFQHHAFIINANLS